MPAKKTTAKKAAPAKGKGFMFGKKVTEKKTGEVYASKGAMMKAEKSEGMKEMTKEYGAKTAAKKMVAKKAPVKKAAVKKVVKKK